MKYKIKNNGSALLTVIGLSGLFIIVLNVMSKSFLFDLKENSLRSATNESQILAHDILSSLSDSRNCTINFNKVFTGNLKNKFKSAQEFKINRVSNAVKELFNDTRYENEFKGLVAKNFKSEGSNVYRGDLYFELEKKQKVSGPQNSIQKFSMLVNVKSPADPSFLSCRVVFKFAGEEAVKSVDLPKDGCDDRDRLVFDDDGKLVCAKTKGLKIPASFKRYPIICSKSKATPGSKHKKLFKDRCVSLNINTASGGYISGFWHDFKNASIPNLITNPPGAELTTILHTAEVNGTGHLEAVIPVAYKKTSPTQETYDSAFIGLVYYKELSTSHWIFAGSADLWNPFKGPFFADVYIGDDFGGTNLVFAKLQNLIKGKKYQVRLSIVSVDREKPSVIHPLWFGAMKFGHYYTDSSIIITEFHN